QAGGRLSKRNPDLLEAIPGIILLHGEQFAALLDNREFLNQPFELRNQMRGDENRPVFRIAGVIGPDNRLDKFPADDWIQSRGWFIEHEQLWFVADRPDQGEVRLMALGEVAGLLIRI